MSIRKIALMGHPVLARPAALVADPTAPEVRALVRDMIETLAEEDGAGLAAPQVHVPLRVVVFHVPAGRAGGERDDGAQPLTVLVNPEIEPLDDELIIGWEACLSLPGLMGAVPRHARIRYRGTTPEGEVVERLAAGFHARVVQHECDHLDGILYPMRITDFSQFGFAEEVRRAAVALEADEADEADEVEAEADEAEVA